MAERETARRRSSVDEVSDLSSAFSRTVAEGEDRLERTWPGLLATGAIAGVDVGFGVFALLIVKQATRSELLGALAFSIGFVALAIGNSELFTENFLVPVGALLAGRSSGSKLIRLCGGHPRPQPCRRLAVDRPHDERLSQAAPHRRRGGPSVP
jgi:hypothetical protein